MIAAAVLAAFQELRAINGVMTGQIGLAIEGIVRVSGYEHYEIISIEINHCVGDRLVGARVLSPSHAV